MANMYDSLGLGELFEDEEAALKLIGDVVENGKVIKGYYEHAYIIKNYGSAEFVIRVITDDNKNYVSGVDTHSQGMCVWDTRLAAFGEITPETADVLEKRVGVYNNETGEGLAIVNLINADVLPSFLPDERVKMQIVGLALDVNYYEDEEAYIDSIEETESGEKYILRGGEVFPMGFMNNRQVGSSSFEKAYEYEDVNIVVGTVEKLYYGNFDVEENSMNTYIRCIIESNFGPLEIVHSYEQIKEGQDDKIKVGATIVASVVLSGDVAIYDYDKGIVRDEERDLRALRYAFARGNAERIGELLSDDCIYTSEVSGKKLTGKDDIIQHINYVYREGDKYFAHMAVIVDPDICDDLQFNEGKKCIVLANGKEDQFESIVFIDYDRNGAISEIILTNDSRYKFRIERAPEYEY